MEKRSIEFTKDESLAIMAGLEIALKQAGDKYVDTYQYFRTKLNKAFSTPVEPVEPAKQEEKDSKKVNKG